MGKGINEKRKTRSAGNFHATVLLLQNAYGKSIEDVLYNLYFPIFTAVE